MQSTFELASQPVNHPCVTSDNASHPPIPRLLHLHLRITVTHPLLLLPTRHDSRWTLLALDITTAGATRLDALHGPHASSITLWHLAEDDVTTIEPGGDDGGDEELRAVGVGAGVGHAEHEGAAVGELEVLVCEFLAVDGFAARALGLTASISVVFR